MRIILSLVLAGGLLYYSDAGAVLRSIPGIWQDAHELLDRGAAKIR